MSLRSDSRYSSSATYPSSGELLLPATPEELVNSADFLLSHVESIPVMTAQRLVAGLKAIFPDTTQDPASIYGADFDLTNEINTQLKTVKALRQAILTEDGQIRDGMTTKDVTELNRVSTNLTNLLMKHHKEVVNMERMRAIEESVLSVVMTWPDTDERQKFIKALEEALEPLP